MGGDGLYRKLSCLVDTQQGNFHVRCLEVWMLYKYKLAVYTRSHSLSSWTLYFVGRPLFCGNYKVQTLFGQSTQKVSQPESTQPPYLLKPTVSGMPKEALGWVSLEYRSNGP